MNKKNDNYFVPEMWHYKLQDMLDNFMKLELVSNQQNRSSGRVRLFMDCGDVAVYRERKHNYY